MRYYFDNRNRDGIALSIYCDNILYDNIYLKKNAIVLIEINVECRKIRFSFGGEYSTPKKIERKIVSSLPIEIEYFDKCEKAFYTNKKINFPYDVIIDVLKYSQDLVLYPSIVKECSVKNISYFKPIGIDDKEEIPVALKKKSDLKTKELRSKLLRESGAFFVILAIMLLGCFRTLNTEFTIPALAVKYHDWAIISIVCLTFMFILSLGIFFRELCYKAVYNEEDLEDIIEINSIQK